MPPGLPSMAFVSSRLYSSFRSFLSMVVLPYASCMTFLAAPATPYQKGQRQCLLPLPMRAAMPCSFCPRQVRPRPCGSRAAFPHSSAAWWAGRSAHAFPVLSVPVPDFVVPVVSLVHHRVQQHRHRPCNGNKIRVVIDFEDPANAPDQG